MDRPSRTRADPAQRLGSRGGTSYGSTAWRTSVKSRCECSGDGFGRSRIPQRRRASLRGAPGTARPGPRRSPRTRCWATYLSWPRAPTGQRNGRSLTSPPACLPSSRKFSARAFLHADEHGRPTSTNTTRRVSASTVSSTSPIRSSSGMTATRERASGTREHVSSSPRRCAARCSAPPRRVAERHQEHDALPCRVRREEASHVIVEEGEAGSAQAERVGGQVALAALERRLELRGAVAAVSVALQYGLQVDEPVDAGGRLSGQRVPE